GRRPFACDDLAAVPDIVEGRCPRPRSLEPLLHEAVEAVIVRAMAPRPSARFQSARDMAQGVARAALAAGLSVGPSEVACSFDTSLLALARPTEQEVRTAVERRRASRVEPAVAVAGLG